VQKYVLSELDSGERVISERLAHVRSVAIGFWIGAGSRDEKADRAGVSHFIEHLLFKGTATYTAQQIAEIFDTLGGELNAATSREHTVVYARVPDDQLQTALDVMGEMVFAPAFAELAAERVEDLGDLLGRVRGRALEEQVLDEVGNAGAIGLLVARSCPDPKADRDGAHVREPLRDDALARIELAQDVLLHGRMVLGRLVPQVGDAVRR
jgi:hypothetical protein